MNSDQVTLAQTEAADVISAAHANKWFSMAAASRAVGMSRSYFGEFLLKKSPRRLPFEICMRLRDFTEAQGLGDLWTFERPSQKARVRVKAIGKPSADRQSTLF